MHLTVLNKHKHNRAWISIENQLVRTLASCCAWLRRNAARFMYALRCLGRSVKAMVHRNPPKKARRATPYLPPSRPFHSQLDIIQSGIHLQITVFTMNPSPFCWGSAFAAQHVSSRCKMTVGNNHPIINIQQHIELGLKQSSVCNLTWVWRLDLWSNLD